MALFDLLGRRWSLRVIWELRGTGLTFRDLQSRCGGVSSSVLADRLRELTDAALVRHAGDGYQLTSQGEGLLDLLGPLDAWASQWRHGASHEEHPEPTT